MTRNSTFLSRRTTLAATGLWTLLFAPVALAQAHHAATPVAQVSAPSLPRGDSAATRYRTVRIDGLDIFYREAGSANAPVILLLHGFPASSFMYRDLMSQLAGKFRVIAPDYPGFGYSAAPSTKEFDYTFDRLADVIEKFTDRMGLRKYAIYMQDFGGPVGFRLASGEPETVSALIAQNANAYEEGLPDSFWAPARTLWKDPSPANFAKIREARSRTPRLSGTTPTG